MKIDLVVTRHPGLLQYLQELGLADESTRVLSHANVNDVRGLNVCGVLPHSLSCECSSFTEVPLDLPQELRGKELTYEQVRQYAGKPATYVVSRQHVYVCPVCEHTYEDEDEYLRCYS